MNDLVNRAQLRVLVTNNTGKMINFGRTLRVSYPDLLDWLTEVTHYLPADVKSTERVYHVIHGLTARPKCPITQEDLRFLNFFLGYREFSMTGVKERAESRKNIEKPVPPTHAALLKYAAMVGSSDISVGSNIKKLIKLNRLRNADLYDLPDDREGIDFVVCPVLGMRKLNIKGNYITDVLLMTVNEFHIRYPETKLTCDGHRRRIAAGVNEEIAPGLTRHGAAMIKATAIKKEVGDDGLSIDQRKGLKTRETHMKRDENGLNGYQKIAMVARPKQNDTMARSQQRAGNELREKWLAFRDFCIWVTAPVKGSILGDRPTGRAGTKGAWQVDHKYSLIKAFHNKVSPFVVGSRPNLEPIRWEDNNKKRGACSIDLNMLLEQSGIPVERSMLDFELFEQAFDELEIRTTPGLYLKMKEIADETGIPFEYRLRDDDSGWVGVL